MKIKYVAKNYKISDRFKEVLERKLEKLDKYFPKGCDAKVNCTEQNDIEKLEITLNADNMFVRGEVSNALCHQPFHLHPMAFSRN